jgi:hypothetical protein
VAVRSAWYGGAARPQPELGEPDDRDRLPLAELLAKAGDGDFLRGVGEAVLQMFSGSIAASVSTA